MNTEKIGNVIKIPNAYQLVVQTDSGQFVVKGEAVAVYEIASKIVDPETNETLGTYDFIKEELVVEEVFDSYFICSKIVTKEIDPFAIDAFRSKQVHERSKLDVDPTQNENLELTDKTIRLGDAVKRIG